MFPGGFPFHQFNTRGIRQKTICDRREFDKLMESGSRVIEFGLFLHLGAFDAPSRLKGGGFRKWLSLGWGFRL